MSIDKIVLSYHDSLLRDSDVCLLNERNWLNDSLIAFWMEYLQQDKYKDLSEDIAFVNPQITHFLKLTSQDEGRNMIESLGLKTKGLIVLAINDCKLDLAYGGSHWSLLIYRKGAGFEHYDSYLGSNLPDAKYVARVINSSINVIPNESKNIVKEMCCIQQKNGYDCGVHTIFNADAICEGFQSSNKADLNSQVMAKKISIGRHTLKRLISSLK